MLRIVREDQPPSCPICLLELDSHLATLKCGHTFHATCIQLAIRYKESCPICKLPAKEAVELRLSSMKQLKLRGAVGHADLREFARWRSDTIVRAFYTQTRTR